jgi:hypothetical protein
MTGISRKEITKIRQETDENRWTPAMEVTPANLILHYWHFDKDFCEESGVASPLPIDGEISFAELVRRYAGDIPLGALKEELKRVGVVSEQDGVLAVRKRYFQPEQLHEDFIRNIMFSVHNLACTVVHNAALVSRDDFTATLNEEQGRFERFAWSDQLDLESRLAFQRWVRDEGTRFIERADHWIGDHEVGKAVENGERQKSIGVGVYFFDDT